MKNDSFQYTGDDVLEIMSKYAVNRNNTIERLIRKYFALDNLQSPKKILEFGAGRGEFINRFINKKNLATYLVELDDAYLLELSKHHIAYKTIDSLNEKVDYIYLIDVLEHINNDSEYLSKFYDKLEIGGKLLIYVPARMELYSEFDRRIGHFRRYTKEEIQSKVENAGFKVEVLKYHEILGYIVAYYNKFFSKSGKLIPEFVKLYDMFVVPITNFLEKFIEAPIGKSLYLVAVKK